MAQAVVVSPNNGAETATHVLAYDADPAGSLEAQGNRQLDGNVCPTYGGCGADGVAFWKEFEQTEMDPAHQDIPSSRSTFIQNHSHTATGSDPG